MMRVVFALISVLFVGEALAQTDNPCQIADGVLQVGFPLPRVAAAIENKHLDIVVLGTRSSALAGAGGPGKAYPARFEAALQEKLPDVAIRVITNAKPRQTAQDMRKEIAPILSRERPALIIWQTGTGDAIRGIDPDAFGAALDEGVSAARAGGSDIILMNMQYSPRTETMINLSPYLDIMRFVALEREINLFDRFAIMKYWNEVGTFDLSAATKRADLAERVHYCIGRLLAEFVLESTKLTASDDKATHQ
jgi:lysophospholipase L1-like esterase